MSQILKPLFYMRFTKPIVISANYYAELLNRSTREWSTSDVFAVYSAHDLLDRVHISYRYVDPDGSIIPNINGHMQCEHTTLSSSSFIKLPGSPITRPLIKVPL